jgi:hypothetical protein
MLGKLKCLAVLTSLGFVAACGSSGNQSSDSSSNKKIRNASQAASALMPSGIDILFQSGDPVNNRTDSFRTGLINFNSVSQYVDQPIAFRASLKGGPAADYVRANNVPLYVYAITTFDVTKLDKKEGAKPRISSKPVTLQKSKCWGYKFVLNAENNYTIAMSGTQMVEIRNKGSSSMSIGIFTASSSSDWEAQGAEAKANVAAVRLKPFMVVESGGRYKNSEGYGPPVVVPSTRSKACVYSGQKEFFKGRPTGSVLSAPKVNY